MTKSLSLGGGNRAHLVVHLFFVGANSSLAVDEELEMARLDRLDH